jgi:hypothetical protein
VFMKNIFYSIFLLGGPLWKKSTERVKSRSYYHKWSIYTHQGYLTILRYLLIKNDVYSRDQNYTACTSGGTS